MTHFHLPCDPENPGQVLACCGLWELLCRRSGKLRSSRFQLTQHQGSFALETTKKELQECLEELQGCEVGVSPDQANHLGEDEKETLLIPDPFHLRLDWWVDRQAQPVPKTWTGDVKPSSFFPKYQKALKPKEGLEGLWDFNCPWDSASLPLSLEGPRILNLWDFNCPWDSASPCLDPREFSHALDTGFSLYDLKNDLQIPSSTFVHVELLAFIGLQRFRPKAEEKNQFSYHLWQQDLMPSVAALVFCGAIALGEPRGFCFRLRPRDQKQRYKAVSFAAPKGAKP